MLKIIYCKHKFDHNLGINSRTEAIPWGYVMKTYGESTPFLTSELNGQLHDPATLSFIHVGGWAPEQVWTLQRKTKTLPLPGIQPRLFSRATPSLLTIQTELDLVPL
jgi:hypothetical protein